MKECIRPMVQDGVAAAAGGTQQPTVGGGLWDYDIDGDDLFCNRRWYEIVGLDPAYAAIRSIVEFTPFIHPDDVATATEVDLDKIADLIARDQPYHVAFRIRRPDGSERTIRSVACLVRDRVTGHRRAVGCITDITDLAASDAALTEYGLLGDGGERPPGARPVLLLSDKERECLGWVSVGKTAWETAVIIGRSRRTVEFHLRNAIHKLGAVNKIHAAAIAIRLHLL